MNFKVRKALVVIIWILSFFVLMYGLVLFAFEHSEQSNKQTVRNVLQEMKTDMVYIMADDGAVRLDYDKENLAKGKAVRILQDYGLEENVPDNMLPAISSDHSRYSACSGKIPCQARSS